MTFRAVLVTLVTLSTAAAPAYSQGGTFGARPIYLRGTAHAWTLSLDQPIEEVFDAVKAAGKKHRLSVTSRDEESGVVRLLRGNQKGSTLDKHCTFPIVNYYSWQPIENYAAAQNTALTRRRPGETLAQAGRLNGSVYVTIRQVAENTYSVQSICSATLHDWGVLEATSRGVLESAFLEDLLERLGTPMEVALPEIRVVEPSRENPTRDLHLAQQCMERCTPLYRCGGMFVDPDSLELRCVDAGNGTALDK